MSTPVGADPAVVGPYLASVLGDDRWRRVRVELIAAGMSNLTYVVTPEGGSDDDAVILRRPPTGAVLATAHDMVREHRVISALGSTPVPVPRTLHLCTDPAVLGAPFYVMERVDGLVIREELPAVFDPPEERRRIGEEAIEALVARTRKYAAYQRKWMRRIPGLVSVAADRRAGEVADEILEMARSRQRLPAGPAG